MSDVVPRIELRGISKHFDLGGQSIATLSDVELAVAPGEFVTLVGPSGCGKSTLFNILVGLVEPDPGGQMLIDGKPEAADHLLGQVAFMPQRDMLLPWRSVVDNAILAAEIDGIPRRVARERAVAALDRFGLRGFGGHYPSQLSGGMRQRVALMRTFMFERDIMLLDEPFGALDALTRSLMQRWLLEVWEGPPGQSPDTESKRSDSPSPLRGGAGVGVEQEAPATVPSARPPPGPPLCSDNPPRKGEGITKPLAGSQAIALEGARRTVLFITHDIDEAIYLGDRVLVMSARPGHIKLDLPVQLPRPRRPEIVTDMDFVALKRTLLAAVEDESIKTFQSMNQPAAAAGASG